MPGPSKAKDVHLIGLTPAELPSLRLLIALLRHPDPSIGELARQALYYLQGVAAKSAQPTPSPTTVISTRREPRKR